MVFSRAQVGDYNPLPKRSVATRHIKWDQIVQLPHRRQLFLYGIRKGLLVNRQEVRILAGRVYVAHELNSAEAGHRP